MAASELETPLPKPWQGGDVDNVRKPRIRKATWKCDKTMGRAEANLIKVRAYKTHTYAHAQALL